MFDRSADSSLPQPVRSLRPTHMRAVLHLSPSPRSGNGHRRIGQNGFKLMLEGDLVPHLKYPWQQVVLDAFIELLPRKLKAAERVICARLHDSRTTDFDEQFALQYALGSLRILLPPKKQSRRQIGEGRNRVTPQRRSVGLKRGSRAVRRAPHKNEFKWGAKSRRHNFDRKVKNGKNAQGCRGSERAAHPKRMGRARK
jgi:hypothetical protein